MKEKGYVYTLIIIMFVLILLSLISYYFVLSQPVISEAIAKMRTDELYYFAESVKMDYDRSLSVACQRSLVYVIDNSIKTRETYKDYEMHNCTRLHYQTNGSQAAATELMLCGTLHGIPVQPPDFMENHTLLKWSERIADQGLEQNMLVDAEIGSIEIIPYDPWTIYVVSKLDLSVYDTSNATFYRGYDIPVVSKIELDTMEDPLYAVETGNPDLIRYFTPCNTTTPDNSTAVAAWIDSQCYRMSEHAPSFFDRLDGRVNKSEYYTEQSQKLGKIGITPQSLGLESLVDVDTFAAYNASAWYNLSWIDFNYWKKTPAYCSFTNADSHKRFKIDGEHAVEYNMKNLNCSVLFTTSFTPDTLRVPVNTTITWINSLKAESCNLIVDASGWTAKDVLPEEQAYWTFNETGTYHPACLLSPSAAFFTSTIEITP
ncbi:MAG: hypothetical protein PHG85_02485 [Candidatus Altiarchaeota archaeon]|nr:hypothetical protein [Candidatus Altiarchaeota archaeon]